MTTKTGIAMEDKRSIVAFMKLIHARTKAGEEVCVKCYIQKTIEILDKYNDMVHTNNKREIKE